MNQIPANLQATFNGIADVVLGLNYPARLFRTGLNTTNGIRGLQGVDSQTLRTRVVVFYGGLAVIVVLVGVASCRSAVSRMTRWTP